MHDHYQLGLVVGVALVAIPMMVWLLWQMERGVYPPATVIVGGAVFIFVTLSALWLGRSR